MESIPAAARVILITWGVMAVLYALGRGWLKTRLLPRATIIRLSAAAQAQTRQGDWSARAGTLWVFMANICTAGLVIAALCLPAVSTFLATVRIALPAGVTALGRLLFVAGQLWGLGAMLYNPHYTPLYRPLRREFILATQGPYALVRHPRYAAEAALNGALFLLTGVWLPLLGLLGWWGLHRQAVAEEQCLLAIVGEPYREYRRQTGMFWPRLRKGN